MDDPTRLECTMNRSIVFCAGLCVLFCATQVMAAPTTLDPDEPVANGTILNTYWASDGVTLSGVDTGYQGPGGLSNTIICWDGETEYPPHPPADPLPSPPVRPSTGTRVFAFVPNDDDTRILDQARPDWAWLRVDFDDLVAYASIDVILSDTNDAAKLLAFDEFDDPIPSVPPTDPLDPWYGKYLPNHRPDTPGTSDVGGVEPARFSLDEALIKYIRVSGYLDGQDVYLDNLGYSVEPYAGGEIIPEPAGIVLLLIGAVGLILVRCRRK